MILPSVALHHGHLTDVHARRLERRRRTLSKKDVSVIASVRIVIHLRRCNACCLSFLCIFSPFVRTQISLAAASDAFPARLRIAPTLRPTLSQP
ncbi:hypothetical protein DENSPDRAFT_689690 [Dentipellis sp. KUC8613]|nr:hypothetical protein DENSPDRAFT_689690 [Dentipellis sp. KUC8613]